MEIAYLPAPEVVEIPQHDIDKLLQYISELKGQYQKLLDDRFCYWEIARIQDDCEAKLRKIFMQAAVMEDMRRARQRELEG